MRLRYRAKERESGIVLITVVIMSLILMIFAVSLLSINANQFYAVQHQIDRIKAEQLSKGAFWFAYMNNFSNRDPANAANWPPAETLDNKRYTMNIIVTPNVVPFGTSRYEANVLYNAIIGGL